MRHQQIDRQKLNLKGCRGMDLQVSVKQYRKLIFYLENLTTSLLIHC